MSEPAAPAPDAAASAARPDPAAMAALDRAWELRQAGRLAEAEAVCREFLADSAGDPELRNLLGALLMDQGRVEPALEAFAAVLAARPNHGLALFNQGLALQSIGRLDDAIASLQRAAVLRPGDADCQYQLGAALHRRGRMREAAAAYRRTVAARPDHVLAHNNLGVVLEAEGALDAAADSYRRAIALRPETAEPHLNLGNIHQARGRRDEAVACYRRAIELKPDYVLAHTNLGNTLLALGKPDDAVAAHRQAVALEPSHVAAHNNLGNALKALGRLDEAAAAYLQAITLDPDFAVAHGNLGTVYQEQGRLAEAVACYRRNVALRPDSPAAHVYLASVTRFRPGDPQIAAMQRLLARPSLSPDERVRLLFALGKAHDQIGEYDMAFRCFAEGNGIARQTIAYDARDMETLVDRLTAVFARSAFAAADGYGSDSELPIFVVGMPRAGKSLVEALLARHPEVRAGTEAYELERIVGGLAERLGESRAYPDCVAGLTAAAARALGDEYADALRARHPGAVHVTNTRPTNFAHLGLIRLILPRARIVHCVRDPLDTCLAGYFENYPNQPFAYDLTELGRYYAQYRRLMAHWRAVLPAPILEIAYEDLVRDTEQTTRRIYAFCGLAWAAAFPPGDRAAGGAAEPFPIRLHGSAVGRWRRYDRHLAPLRQALAPNRPAPARTP